MQTLPRLLLIVALALLVAGCAADQPSATPPTPPAAPSRVARVPTIQMQPAAGGPGTQITVLAAGFPADAHVTVYLAGPDGQRRDSSFGEALTGADGRVGILFVLPAAWADGTPIAAGKLLVFLATDDDAQVAGATFTFQR